jgi:predicted PurR-regulated permease PerM
MTFCNVHSKGAAEPQPVLDLDQARDSRAISKVECRVAPANRVDVVKMPLRVFRENRSSEEIVQLAIRLGLLAFLIYWSFVLVRPFIAIFAWSVVLAVALYPAFSWLSVHLGGRPKLAAAIITSVNLAIIIGPATWLGLGLIESLRSFAGQLDSGNLIVPSPPDSVKDWPIVGTQLYVLWDHASINLRAALSELAPHLKPLAGPVLAFAGSAGAGTLKFIAAVLLSGFLFPAGPRLVAAIRNIQARLQLRRGQDFVALAGATIRTVSQGVIGIAIVQPLVGIGLKLAGIASAGVLAFAVLVLAIMQIGSVVVLLPVIIWIWATKDFMAALLITIYLLVVGWPTTS